MRRCPHPADDGAPGHDTLAGRLRHTAARHLDDRRRTALRLLLSFGITFGLIRALTYAIHVQLGPFHDIVTGGGLHIHHYVWGIALVLVSGFLSLTLDQSRWHPWLAIPFGVGAALVVDEFALLLNLRDVYWERQGRSSVDLGIVLLTLLGLYYAAECYWRQAAADLRWAVRRLARRR
jgi:hypothetical protein